ncbi:uncharacterized protein LOC126677569 isoform X2 [Mercurialis annua]|uniref:uncharacterized protein LOC126677569 isoform X2 n=1 Tax=Mercurialis annua TaxID=3986 RepID=UPI00215F3EB9|nr:uncharacterized protein LOC126677569 isoform X2 [Mercurialis annua]XP_050228211.1 uncharacterized protein LOC126677569 isoform X2 [Mercurialis annua]
MVLVQSSKISLPSSSTPTNSFLFEPNSHSLALMHSDSSVSVFPSLSFPSLSSLPNKPQPTLVPSPSSSSSFILLQQDSTNLNNPSVLFLTAGPYKGGSQILFRLFLLQKDRVFSKVNAVCNQKGLDFDAKLGVLMDVNHGVSLKIVGSVNFFVMYSVSSRKVWVFSLKLIGNGDVVKLMRCAVIECCVPVWSISASFGFLILGEHNGVRVFNLRQLVKGNSKKIKSSNSDLVIVKPESKGLKLPNGMIGSDHRSVSATCNGLLDEKIDKHYISVKEKYVKCRQDSDDGGAFVAFKSKDAVGLKSPVKAVSIQALFPKKLIILDSSGDLHILSLPNPVGALNVRFQMMHLPHSMKVQKLAILPDVSSKIQTIWISDRLHTVHMMMASEMDDEVNKNDGDENQEKLMQISGNIYAYAMP